MRARHSRLTSMQFAYYVTATDSDDPCICLPRATVFARWDFPIKLWLIPWRTVRTCARLFTAETKEVERQGGVERQIDRERENTGKIDVNLISIVERDGQFARYRKSAYAPPRDTYISRSLSVYSISDVLSRKCFNNVRGVRYSRMEFTVHQAFFSGRGKR